MERPGRLPLLKANGGPRRNCRPRSCSRRSTASPWGAAPARSRPSPHDRTPDFARDAVAPVHVYLEEAAGILAVGRPVRRRTRQLLGAALRHALALSTWHSLTTNGITRTDATKLLAALVEAAAERGTAV